MSDSGSDREWTFVDNRDDENHSSDSGSSSDFVHVDGKSTVFYHHKSDDHPVTSEDRDQSSVSGHCTENTANNQVRAEATEQCPSVGDGSSDVLMSGSESVQPEGDEADSEGLAPELLDGLEHSLRDDSENSEPELLDEQVVSALTCPGSVETLPLDDGAQDQPAPADNGLIQTPSDGVTISESSDSHTGDTLSWEENQWFWDDEVVSPDMQPFEEPGPATDHASSQNDSASDGHEEAESGSQSSSGIEELAMPEEEEEAERMAQSVDDGHDIVHVTLPSVEVLKREEKASKTSDSESDFSDIVRIEQNPSDDASTSQQEHRHYFRAVDLMQVSASSTSSSGNSSLSSRFHFVHPLPRRHRYIYPRDEEDDSDPDLSSISYSLDQLEIMEGDVIRSYKHRPNSTLNTFLSILALLTLCTTIGVGIGHYLGTTREVMLRSQQVVRIKEIQEEYLRCLRNQELLEAQVSITDAEKIAAVTAVWKQKYEELIIEKVELEQTMKQLEKNMDDDLREAKNKLLANRNEAELLGDDINSLDYHQQYDHGKSTISSGHGTKESVLRPSVERRQMYIAEKEARLIRQHSELDGRELRLEKREAELNEKSELLSKQQADLSTREASLARDKDTLTQRNERLDLNEAKLNKKELLLAERAAHLREERDQLEKDKGNMRKEQNDLRNSQTKLQEERDLLQKEQTRIQIEWTELQKVQAAMQGEQIRLENERAKLEEKQNKLQKQQMETEKEQVEQLQYFNRFKELQEQTNLLRIENDELRQQVARLRYSAYHQQDKKLKLNDKELKEFANSLANENIDLKTAVAKLRYTKPFPVDNKGIDNLASGSADEKVDTGIVHQSGSPLPDEVLNKKSSGEQKQDEDWFPFIWSYLNLLVPAIDLSDLQKVMFSSKITKPLAIHFQFIQNITSNAKFVDTVKEKLSELKMILGNSFKTDQINSDVSAIIADLKAIFQKEIASFQQYIQWEELQAKKQADDRSIGSEPARKYHEFVNKTTQGVLHLNEKIKHAWSKVKNVTGDFLKKNKVLKEFGDSVTNSVKQVKKTMEAKWKKVKKHFLKKGMIPDAWAWSGHKKARHGNRHGSKHNCPTKHGHGCKRADTVRSSYETHYHDHMGHETLETKQFKKDPAHQNKQSSATDYEKYEEYWQQAEFEPDDFLQEGFFEGNNRKWHKHQNKARKLHGRLQRLTDDIFLAMDDDDVEDMYEDFEDLQEDIDSQDQPKELMTWLTCQVRWWKSRLYRKHSNEDLVKGCGRQLMQWQLRALCKPCDLAQKRCRKRQRGATEGPFCHYYQSVILPSLNQGLQGAAAGKRDCDGVRSSRKVLNFVVDSDTPYVEGQLETENGRLKYSMSLDGDDVAPKPIRVGNDTDDALDGEPSAKWLFERAEDRESFHHNGLWMFKRGALRDFERNKPWYYERADHRADKRFSRSVGGQQDRNNADRYDRSGKN